MPTGNGRQNRCNTTPARRPSRPGLDPIRDQAARLNEALRTDELRDALARRAQLREQHQSSTAYIPNCRGPHIATSAAIRTTAANADSVSSSV